MHVYYVVNVDYLRVHEPSMLNEDEEDQVLPSMEYLALNTHEKLMEDDFIKKYQNDKKESTRNFASGIQWTTINLAKW